MNTLAIAKRSARARRRQGGAAMFVVAMTLAVLASVGIYALAAAALEVRTSGNERQNTQTHYLSEYGIIGVSYELTPWKTKWYVDAMKKKPDTGCVSLPGVPATADIMTRACWRMASSEIGTAQAGGAWASPRVISYVGTSPFEANTAPGSFGPVPMNGDFFVELTEPIQAQPPSGYALGLNLCFVEITATSGGITQPVFAGASDSATAGFGGEGIEAQRARLVAGPMQCFF
ncbi:MAG TPA: pilus assembly PilX N-terminal domain-containing protein [Polyangiaceae bacterium]|nr:pilus assembly PilX N-terminal domain-containing protein [Polyangiaceae bacterium]